MNKLQKYILIKFIVVVTVTFLAIVAIINFKDWVNRSEAMMAMEQLGEAVLQYRKEVGSVPPESYVNEIKMSLKGSARLGKVYYRAVWLDIDSDDDEILAYTKKEYSSLILSSGFIVLRLDGRIEWMDGKQFHEILAPQQSQFEIETTREQDGSLP